MKSKPILLSIVSVAIIGACTTFKANIPSNDNMLASLTEQDGRVCIRTNDIRGFGVLGDDVISVDSRRGSYFLMTTLYFCPSLRTSHTIGFAGDFTEFCGGGRDSVYTGDESCPIKAIYEFTSRKEAFATFDVIKAKREALLEELENAKQKAE